MHIEVSPHPTADEMLTAFFTLTGEHLQGRRAERHATAERDLRRCFEDCIDRFFAPEERAIVDAERQFDPLGAAARLAAPHVILKVLPHYVQEREWLGRDLEDRRVRLRLTERLLDMVVSFPPMEEVDIRHLARSVRLALARGRVALEAERAETGPTRSRSRQG